MADHLTNLTLKIWRQASPDVEGHFESYRMDSISDEASARKSSTHFGSLSKAATKAWVCVETGAK